MSRIIELRWDCDECGTKDILGRHKRCLNCKSPREKAEMKMSGLGSDDYGPDGRNKAATVTDAAVLDLAGAGADWFCIHCDAGNRGDSDRCVGQNSNGCGAPRYGKVEEDHPDLPGGHRDVIIGDDPWEDGYEPPEWRGDEDEGTVDTEPPSPRQERWQDAYEEDPAQDYLDGRIRESNLRVVAIVGAALVCCTLLTGFLWWAFTTHEAQGTVTAMTWQQDTHRQHWTTYTTREWKDETRTRREIEPRNGSGEQAGMESLGGCREEHHHDIQVVCGSHQECRDVCTSVADGQSCTESCTDNGNGTATCRDICTTNYRQECREECNRVTDYCDEPVYETRCNYETQAWKPAETKTDRGAGPDTAWPVIEPGRLDRLRYSADYTVGIDYHDRGKDKTYPHKPGNTKGWLGKKTLTEPQAKKAERAYRSWEPGEVVTLEVRNIGSVARVHRGDQAIEVAEAPE